MSVLQVVTAQVTTLSDGTNSTSSTNAILGSAKAWVNFNGTTSPGTIRASYNVSSVTKNGTGDYTVNFTNALANANYSCMVATQADAVPDRRYIPSVKYNSRATGSVGVWVGYTSNAVYDTEYYAVAIFGG